MSVRTGSVAVVMVLLLTACPPREGPQPAPSASSTFPSPAAPSPTQAPAPPARTARELRTAITATGLRGRLDALQAIADANDGTRADGTSGYRASVEYVRRALASFGYGVRLEPFTMPVFDQLGPTRVEGPGLASLEDGRDFRAMLLSASGDVHGRVVSVGTGSNPPGGCSSGDFAGFPSGAIALVDTGGCYNRDKVRNASVAGAVAVLVRYPNIPAGRPLRPTLITPEGIDVPAVAVTGPAGSALAAAGGDVRVAVNGRVRTATVWNVIAEAGPADGRRVVLGAHLDSVIDGPGVNDDGSGVAALLEIARAVAGGPLASRLSFAFWAGEEYGLYGSRRHVDGLDAAARARVIAYLNADMLASHNGVPFLYGGTSRGSSAVETAIREALGLEARGGITLVIGSVSDHGPFVDAGIPVGGLYSGSEEIKTATQAPEFGGRANEPADACYHQPCDRLSRVNLRLFEILADALGATAVALLAGAA